MRGGVGGEGGDRIVWLRSRLRNELSAGPEAPFSPNELVARVLSLLAAGAHAQRRLASKTLCLRADPPPQSVIWLVEVRDITLTR